MKWLLDRFREHAETVAFVHNGRKVSYGEVCGLIEDFSARLEAEKIAAGQKVVVVGDYSPEVFCMLLALAIGRCMVIPLSRQSVVEEDVALQVCGSDWIVTFDEQGRSFDIAAKTIPVRNELLDTFIAKGKPGLILFSSGSTGAPKAILHDFDRVAEKFQKQRRPLITIPFLMIDHFGGINTILAITSSLGTLVTIDDRSIPMLCKAIETYKVELLPVTPSFLNLLLMLRGHETHDLSSIKRITYGTEVMPQGTLDRLQKAFPNAVLQQTYGLSEVGVLQSQSRPDGSLWLRIGGQGFETQVRDNILWIKSQYRMEGYLNAPSGFDEDGWFNTQDEVVVEGEWFKILGRVTDIINVGGQKVYPVEVENVIMDLDNIEDAAVFGEAHNILGQIVVAKVRLTEPEEVDVLKKRIRAACLAHLTPYKAPSKVILSIESFNSVRQKKIRK